VGLSGLNLWVLVPYLPALGWGALRTVEISALTSPSSFPLGLIGALMRVSDNRFASTVATVYVEIVRNCSSSSRFCFSFCPYMGCRSTPSPPEWRRWRSTAPRLRSRSSAAALPRSRWRSTISNGDRCLRSRGSRLDRTAKAKQSPCRRVSPRHQPHRCRLARRMASAASRQRDTWDECQL